MLPTPPPPPLVRDHVGTHPWVPLDPVGATGSTAWQVGRHRVGHRPAARPGPSVEGEVQRLDWLRPHLPTPEVRVATVDGTGEWLVTAPVAGFPSHRGELHPDLDQLVAGIAAALRRLHDLPVADCPFDGGWDRLAGEIAAALDAGSVDPRAMPEPFSRYEPARLVELWRQGRPEGEDLVVVHGNAALSNLFFEAGTLTAVVDVGRLGVGDRHLDLAVVHESIRRHLGPHAVFAFYEAYGRQPDLVRLEHYRLGALIR